MASSSSPSSGSFPEHALQVKQNSRHWRLQRRLSAGLTFTANYTWNHVLDDVSDGGVANEPFGVFRTNLDITSPQNPFNIPGNYGSADYDVRHYFSANMVLTDMFRPAGFEWGPTRLIVSPL